MSKNDEAGRPARILVIDDNPAIHQDFHKILQIEGEGGKEMDDLSAALFGDSAQAPRASAFVLDDAYQGKEALDKVRQARAEGRPFAMAFVDVRMPPGWDGFQTTVRLWEEDPDLQIVICTAYSDYSWEEMLSTVGLSDRLLVLKKPFETVEAAQLAQSLTVKWRCLQEAKARLMSLEDKVMECTQELKARNPQQTLATHGNARPMINFQFQPNRRLLVVDDEPAMLGFFRKVLCDEEGLGRRLANFEASLYESQRARVQQTRSFSLATASTAAEAISQVDQATAAASGFALVFLDIRLGEGPDGVHVLREIWKRDPNLEVVLCTAYADYSHLDLAREWGHLDQLLVLKKPFESIEVAQMAATLTEKWNQAQHTRVLSGHLEDMVSLRLMELKSAGG